MRNENILEEASKLCHDEWISWTKNLSWELNETVYVLKNNVQYLQEEGDEKNKNKVIKENFELIDKITNRLERWESLWKPYEDLTEEMKEKDRIYARKILELSEQNTFLLDMLDSNSLMDNNLLYRVRILDGLMIIRRNICTEYNTIY